MERAALLVMPGMRPSPARQGWPVAKCRDLSASCQQRSHAWPCVAPRRLARQPADQFWQGVAPLPRVRTEPIHQPLTYGGIEHKVRVRHAPKMTDGRSPPQPKSNRPCHAAASFSQAPNPWRVDAGSRFGEADRMRRDRRERPRRGGRSGTIVRRGRRLRAVPACVAVRAASICVPWRAWPGVRRAGPRQGQSPALTPGQRRRRRRLNFMKALFGSASAARVPGRSQPG